jgi:kynurenine formamidase
VDLSHLVEDGMTTFPGLPAPEVRDHMSHADSRAHYGEGTEFQIGEVRMVANTGTYLDAPFHRFREGVDVSGLPLDRLAGLEGVLVEAPEEVREGGRGVGPDLLEGIELEGRAVLVATGWARHWGTIRYGEGHAFLTAGTARRLAEAGAALVGVDSLNVDDTEDPARPAHTALLGAGIPIVENLRGLEALAGRRFRFTAVPLRVRGMGSFPVRAFAELR